MRMKNSFAIRSSVETYIFPISDSDVLISLAPDKILIVYLNKKALQPLNHVLPRMLCQRNGVKRAYFGQQLFPGNKVACGLAPRCSLFDSANCDCIFSRVRYHHRF